MGYIDTPVQAEPITNLLTSELKLNWANLQAELTNAQMELNLSSNKFKN